MTDTAIAKKTKPPPNVVRHEFVLHRQDILEGYLGKREAGNLVEHSVQGAMLDRIEMGSVRCKRCQGHGVVGVEQLWAAQTAKELGEPFDWGSVDPDFGEQCDRCRGVGVLPRALQHGAGRPCMSCWRLSLAESKVTGESQIQLYWRLRQEHGEHGCDRTPTARSTGQAHTGSGRALQEVALLTYGLGSRLLREVQLVSEVCAFALALYYGDTGSRCSAQFSGATFGGRLFAVYPLTLAGQRLLERSLDQRGKLDPWQRIWYLAHDPSGRHRALVDAADEQSWRLMHTACKRWDSVAQGA